MGTTDTVNQTIDSLLNDWSKIVYLYHLVHEFAEQFKNGKNQQNQSHRFEKCPITQKKTFSNILFILFRNEFAKFCGHKIIFIYKFADWLWSKQRSHRQHILVHEIQRI